MSRFLMGVAPVIILLGIVGCGDSGVTEGTVPFKATDTNTPEFENMKKFMMGNVKGPTPKKGAADKKAETAAPPAEAEKKD